MFVIWCSDFGVNVRMAGLAWVAATATPPPTTPRLSSAATAAVLSRRLICPPRGGRGTCRRRYTPLVETVAIVRSDRLSPWPGDAAEGRPHKVAAVDPAPTDDLSRTIEHLASLPGVAEAVEAARDACTQLRWHQALRRRTAEARAESTARAARASAAIEVPSCPSTSCATSCAGPGPSPRTPWAGPWRGRCAPPWSPVS